MKHLPLDYHFVRQHKQNCDFKVSYISFPEQLVDGFTKAPHKQCFQSLRTKTGVANGSTVFRGHKGSLPLAAPITPSTHGIDHNNPAHSLSKV